MALTGWLVAQLTRSPTRTASPLARVFGPTDLTRRGGTIAFYLLAPDGTPYDVRAVEALASRAGISLQNRAASAIPATARWPTASRATTWRSASSAPRAPVSFE